MTSHRMRYKIGLTEYNVAIKDIDASGSGEGIPLGTILPYSANSEYPPEGFLWCDGSAVSRLMYPDLFALIGTSFGSGDGETTFNLPDLNDRVLQGASVTNPVGTYLSAGLPNITGGGIITINAGTGALEKGNFYANVYGGNSYATYYQTLDASRSSAIYGNSDTVQPPALTVNYIIKAFSAVTQDSQLVDVTQYASALNGKPSKSLDDLTQTGEDHFLNRDFVIIYPNGGTAENPANVTIGIKYVIVNPFPGYAVYCQVELYADNEWGVSQYSEFMNSTGIFTNGTYCYQHNDDSIVMLTGSRSLITPSGVATALHPSTWNKQYTEGYTSVPCRIKVWKVGKIPQNP